MKTYLSALLLTFAPFLRAIDSPTPDHGVQAVREMVRGDSGKWNDSPILQVIPPPTNRPPGMNLDTWADTLREIPMKLQTGKDVWLLFRSRQLDDNDRVWVESIQRSGENITVRMHEAVWQGNYFKTFTYYAVLGVNLGRIPAGNYSVAWIVEPFTFTKLNGDGRPFRRDGTPQGWPKDATPTHAETVKLQTKLSIQ